MRVLVACEFSGIVRDAFIRRGHDAMSCDLLPSESPGPHYQGDVLDILGDGWDLMIAHPPCTYLSNAGAKHLFMGGTLNLERYKQGLDAKLFFKKLLSANMHVITIESPYQARYLKCPNTPKKFNLGNLDTR